MRLLSLTQRLLSAEPGAITDFHARVGWLHDFARNLNDIATFSSFSGASFVLAGARLPSNAAHLQLGIERDVKNFALTVNADVALSAHGNNAGGTAALSYQW